MLLRVISDDDDFAGCVRNQRDYGLLCGGWGEALLSCG